MHMGVFDGLGSSTYSSTNPTTYKCRSLLFLWQHSGWTEFSLQLCWTSKNCFMPSCGNQLIKVEWVQFWTRTTWLRSIFCKFIGFLSNQPFAIWCIQPHSQIIRMLNVKNWRQNILKMRKSVCEVQYEKMPW